MMGYIILILLSIYIIYVLFISYKGNEYGMFWYNFLKLPLGLIFKFYYPYHKSNQLKEVTGPVIFCGNHRHLMDQCLVILESSRPIHYMAKREYFDNPKTRWFFKSVGCIPVDRNVKDTHATNLALDVLHHNLALGIFPEGTRNRTEDLLLPFKFGAVSLAKKTNATIIPFAIKGQYKFRTKNLTITFGEPFKVEGDLEVANNKLYQVILDMLKEK